jgi:response regulator RpfG family c-di-GMP phosphodiesterase
MMPHVTGIDLMRFRQNDSRLRHIPVIVLSANSEKNIKQEALKLGATDFLAKPVDPVELVLRVQNTLLVKQYQDHLRNYAVNLEHQVRIRTEQIERSREQIVHCLAKAAEFRDNETGKHVIRVGKYAALIAKHLGFGPSYCAQIELAAQLHDVGKIGIPDSILLNPGKLTREEFEIMKRHCRPSQRASPAPITKNGTALAIPTDSKARKSPSKGELRVWQTYSTRSAVNVLINQNFLATNAWKSCFRNAVPDSTRKCWTCFSNC